MKPDTSDYKNMKEALINARIKFSTAHNLESDDFILTVSQDMERNVKIVFDKGGAYKETV